jgi:OCT family organic cation transporter-like MFS transporter 4/5
MLTVANNAFTFELFPTVSRGITIALCSTSGKVGAIIAPYIAAMVSFYFFKFVENILTNVFL